LSRLRRLPAASLLSLLLVTSPPAALAADREPEIPSATSSGAPGVAERVTELMARQAVRDAQLARPERDAEEKENEHPRPDRSHLPQNPDSRDDAPAPVKLPRVSAAGGPAIESPQAIGTSFTGATLNGVNPTSSFPPDCMGAVGPSQYVIFVNGRIVSFDKSTGIADGVLNADPDVFFASVRNASTTSDPRIRYDRLTGRWFLLIINVSTPNRILIAVSGPGSSTLTGSTTFTFFYIPIESTPPTISKNCLADYPTLGLDANALYVGTNDFCPNYNGTDAYVIRKSSILGAGPIVVTAFRQLCTGSGSGPYTPQGVDNYDPNATEGYFIGVDNASYGLLQMRRVSNPGGTPTLSTNIPITVPATVVPIRVPHQGSSGGSSGYLDALDDRLFAAHIRNGQLWTAHNIGVNNTGTTSGTTTRDGSRWYHLNVPAGSGTPTLVESGTLYMPSASNTSDQRSYWIPSIMVSGQGHAAMAFSAAGSAEHANAGTVGRLAGDAAGTLETPVLLTNSTTAYNPPGDPGNGSYGRRWGDYSYVSLDPIDDMTMWSVHMFCDTTNSYGVRVTKLVAPPPATPATLADITAGQPGVTLTLTGASSAGSGFYDPGANLSGGVPTFNHVAAAITNAGASGTSPAVTSVTYLDPTSLSLTLDASAATANAPGEHYTLTVTNPDGQIAAAAVVHVVSNSPTVTMAAGPSGNEGDAGTTTLDFGVQLSASSASPVTVRYHTVDGTATVADGDYVAANDSITIAPGFTTGTIHVTVNGDTKYEPDETFSVALTGASGATLGTPASATGTILNDDAAPQLSIAGASVPEGNSGTTPLTFTVSLSRLSSMPVTVHYATADGTATVANADYAATSGDLVIAALASSGNVVVNVIGDLCGEPDETFAVNLSNASGATIATPTATGTILNDDNTTAPTVTVTSPNGGEVLEVASSATLTWTASDDVGVTGVDLLLSRDGGATYPDTIASAVPNTGTYEWTVTPPATTTAFLRVLAHDGACNVGRDTSDAAFQIDDHVTAVGRVPRPTVFALGPVRPNPSHGPVELDYQLPRDASVRLTVVDVQGREIATLVNGPAAAGYHVANWSGATPSGQAPRGLYFARYTAGGRTFTRRFALIH
jgi:hypothetical protein